MHIAILLLAVAGAWGTRRYCVGAIERCHLEARSWRERWSWAIGAIVVPALWCMIAVLAVVVMGTHGTMFGYSVSAIGLWCSGSLIAAITVLLIALLGRSGQIQRELQHYPKTAFISPTLDQTLELRTIASPSWFAGQVGIIKPELTIGRSLLTSLSSEQLEAIIAHECAHAHYHDTLTFFLLGWLRRWTSWLPETREIWHELILLRELRADRWAAQYIDPLLLADTLLTVARSAQQDSTQTATSTPIIAGIGFHDFTSIDSFEARITALIDPEIDPDQSMIMIQNADHQADQLTFKINGWLWAVLACFPLLALPFHHV
ncbi:MAG: M56 family metallopeptidase [Coleofasciculaceae cyanobacterium RL_1_1]|nr:M56 family metallopeptidase [Coleofasciculaceae cyanobacterium RL_1_1]